MRLKILSYNIHKGYDWNNQNYFLAEIKELIKNTGADLVFLQEVIGQNINFKNIGLIDNQCEFLADSVWNEYAYAKNAIYDHGHHGNLILSKFPILNWENLNISTNYFEKRGMLLCQIQIPELQNKIFFAGCLHLNLLHIGRKIQYAMIREKIKSLKIDEKTPFIIAGDFNDWNKKSVDVFEKDLKMEEAFKKMHRSYPKTFPAIFPMMSLDRIYVKNFKIIHSEIWNHTSKIHFSDHLPLYCEVVLEKRL